MAILDLNSGDNNAIMNSMFKRFGKFLLRLNYSYFWQRLSSKVRGAFTTLKDIYDETFCEKSCRIILSQIVQP